MDHARQAQSARDASPEVDRSPDGGASALDDGAAARRTSASLIDAATAGPGAEVPYRGEMERGFGADFSAVRAYTGRGAEMQAMNAEAATTGHDGRIAFADAAPDRATVAHELAHVQQARNTGASAVQAKSLSASSDAAEVEADRAAATVTAGGTIAPGALQTAGAGVMRKEEGSPLVNAMNEVIATHMAGGAELAAFLTSLANGDKATALAQWGLVPGSARRALDEPGILAKLPGAPAGLHDVPDTVLEVLGPSGIAVLHAAGIPLMKKSFGTIILADDANAAAWVAELTAHPPALFLFIGFATPDRTTVTAAQAKQMASFAAVMTGLYPELLWERIYPALEDTTYDADRVQTRAWTVTDVKQMWKGMAELALPPAHVQTIAKGFYLGMNRKDDKGNWVSLGYGWFTSNHHVVMPGGVKYNYDAPGAVPGHGMSGGGATPAGQRRVGHFQSTLSHEVAHGVGASTDGDDWAKKWGDWKTHGTDHWSKQLFDDAAAQAIVDGLIASGTKTGKGVLKPSQARQYMANKIAGRDPGNVMSFGDTFFDIKVWSDAEIRSFITTYFAGEKLTKYFLRGLDPDGAYDANPDNVGADGRVYTYLTRWDNSHASYEGQLLTNRISNYSLSSYKEWFAEQYTEYYRTNKTGGGTMSAGVILKFDEIDKMKYDDDKGELKAPGAADGASPMKQYTDDERKAEFAQMFWWWGS